ncbi:uncharacterized protein N7482_006781 [Penicillium canariense]|uniref:Uncharacterized protein n=1 Tax=Penicillium canariense TaxID=189055 RepID=A0A9W9HYE6_9EURO|nr:uncharacterized protein N7482_006781 [Penicillium canariense]KAJ5159777.1 hypothetical protein N7482_006781 [Penicillium canariense]
MAFQWPEPLFEGGEFKDVFQFAETFELYCAKVYEHAANHPDEAASATYVMDFVSQAYRAVHCLHMQNMATWYLDMDTAIASLQRKAMQYRETRESLSVHHSEASESINDVAKDQTEDAVGKDIENFFSGDFEDDDEDSDWDESSEEETDDEYYEYNEESEEEDDEELQGIRRLQRVSTIQEVPEDDLPERNPTSPANNTTRNEYTATDEATFIPPLMSPEEQAAHDRITAALQRISAKFEDPDPAPLVRVQTRTKQAMQQTPPPTDDSQSEATTVLPESNPDPSSPPQTATTATERAASASEMANAARSASAPIRKASYDGTGVQTLQAGLTRRASIAVLPRRLRTVCHKYVRKAMLPIRGRAH